MHDTDRADDLLTLLQSLHSFLSSLIIVHSMKTYSSMVQNERITPQLTGNVLHKMGELSDLAVEVILSEENQIVYGGVCALTTATESLLNIEQIRLMCDSCDW